MTGEVVRVTCPRNRLVPGPYGGLAVYCGWSGERKPENVGRPCPRCTTGRVWYEAHCDDLLAGHECET